MKVSNEYKNTILTADDLRNLVRVYAYHGENVVDATEPEYEVPVSTLIERTQKQYALSKTLQEFFHIYYINQGDRIDEETARSIIFDLLWELMGQALGLSNLAKRISSEDECELTEAEKAELADDTPPIDVSKLEVL